MMALGKLSGKSIINSKAHLNPNCKPPNEEDVHEAYHTLG